MVFVIILNILSILTVAVIGLTRGVERTLPVAAFLLMLFPEESKIPVSGLFDLTTQRLITITLIFLCFLARKPVNEPASKLPLKSEILILTFWWLLSVANSVVFSISLKTVLSQIFDYFTIYYIYWKYVSSANTVKKILFGMVGGVIVCSVFGAIEAYSGWRVLFLFPRLFHGFDLGPGPAIRVKSTFAHAILFGGALALAIPMALYLLSITKGHRQKIFLWAGTLLMFLCIYKTGSRGPWLALSLSLGLLVVFCRQNLRKYLAITFLLTVTVLLVRPGVSDTLLNTYAQTKDPESERGMSYQWRYALYRIANRELSKSPSRALWGYGPESFRSLQLTDEFQGHTVDFVSCDSSIAQLMIETGYVGLLLVALLLFRAAARAYRSYRELPAPFNTPCIVFFVNMAAFYFLMTNVAIFSWGQQTYILWIGIAMSYAYPRLVEAKNPGQEQNGALARVNIVGHIAGAPVNPYAPRLSSLGRALAGSSHD